MSEANPWTTLSSREVYRNPWIRVREDQVLRPDGAPGIYGVVETKAATGVLALDAAGRVVLVGQYRYPLELYSWELPQGGAEPGEAPLSAIQRELQEEAGVLAESWEPLGAPVHLSNCFTDETGYLYLARELREVEASPEGCEVLAVRRLPLAEALRWVEEGQITDAMSVIGILRAARLELV